MTTWRFLTFSLAVHLIVWLFLWNRAEVELAKKNKSIEVQIVENSLPIMNLPAAPPEVLDASSSKKARVASDRNQRVKKETQAPRLGMARNGNTAKLTPNLKPELPQPRNQKAAIDDNQDLAMGRPRRTSKEIIESAHDPLVTSQSSNTFTDVAQGPITALNSERYLYSTYFNRVESQFRPPWERNFREVVLRSPLTEQNHLAAHPWVTVIEVILDEEGHYVTTHILKSSGNRALDLAPVEAFKEAAFFPNPPSGMIHDDGRVHLLWQITHIVEANALAGQSSQ